MPHLHSSPRPVKRQKKLDQAGSSSASAIDTFNKAEEIETVNNVEEEEEAINIRASSEDIDNVEERSHQTNINDLGFEILDHIFSYFSNPASGNNDSHYESQQNLLSFCQVNNAFYRVAR